MDSNSPIPTIIILDDEFVYYFSMLDPWGASWPMMCQIGNSILEAGDDYLESPYDINFQTNWNYICYWESPDGVVYDGDYGLLEMIDEINPTDVGCDVMVLMSGQYGGATEDGDILGLANPMYRHGGRHFIIDACRGAWAPNANLFQHEASHLFDCSDHKDLTYCIMCYTYTFATRGYCTGCNTQLILNAGRFN